MSKASNLGNYMACCTASAIIWRYILIMEVLKKAAYFTRDNLSGNKQDYLYHTREGNEHRQS